MPKQYLIASESLELKKDEEKVVFSTIRNFSQPYKFILPNGMKIIVFPNSMSHQISHNLWYKVGSSDDPVGRTGLAHFIEHLIFRNFNNKNFIGFKNFIRSLGGEENAFTSYENTIFYQKIPLKGLKNAILYQIDKIRDLNITRKDIEIEKKVVLEERYMNNNITDFLDEEMMAMTFLNSPHHNPILGWTNEIERLTYKDVMKFYKNFYNFNNTFVIFYGNITPKKAYEIAMDTYGKIKINKKMTLHDRRKEPKRYSHVEVSLGSGNSSSPSFQKIWKVPSYKNAQGYEAEAIEILSKILAGAKNSRLYKKLVFDKNMSRSVYSEYTGISDGVGIFYINGNCKRKEDFVKLKDSFEEELQDIAKNGVSEKELEIAKKQIFDRALFLKDNFTELSKFYGSLISVGLPESYLDDFIENLSKVKVSDIQNVVKNYFFSNNSFVGNLI